MKRKVTMLTYTLFLMAGFLIYSGELSESILQSLQLCGTAIIPALFPMFVASKLLCSILSSFNLPKRFQKIWSRLFGLRGESAYAFFLGILGGYPLGVSIICNIYRNRQLSKKEAENALALCNNSGPGFFAAVVGAKVLGSIRAGLILYGLHLLSAILTGVLYAKQAYNPASSPKKMQNSPEGSLLKAIQESCASLINICAMVIFFNALICLLTCAGFFDLLHFLPKLLSVDDMKAFIHGSLELTGGIMSLKGSDNAFILSSVLMAWGGLCIHSQAKLIWTDSALCPKGYYLHKLTQALISACLAWAFTVGILPLLLSLFLLVSVFIRFLRNHTGKTRKYAL